MRWRVALSCYSFDTIYSCTGLKSRLLLFWSFLYVFIHISFITGAGALKLGRDVQTLSHYTYIPLIRVVLWGDD
jgi:hypothetical protein